MANVSQTQLAKKIPMSKQRINKLVRDGVLKPALVKIPGKKVKLLDEDKALEILAALDPSKKRGSISSEYHRAKSQEIQAKVERITFENAVRREKYILKEDAERRIARILKIGREVFENATIELSHSLATETDPQKIFVISGKILSRAFYRMKSVAAISEASAAGISESEIKKALEKVDNAPVGTVTAAKLYSELLRAVSQGLLIIEGDNVKKPGCYDSCFLHDDIVYDTYALFSRLRRSMLEPGADNEDILPRFSVMLKHLRNEIEKRNLDEKTEIGKSYKTLQKFGAKPLK